MKTKIDVLLVSIICVCIALLFHPLLLDLGSKLVDWFDYPYYVWTIYQNIEHFNSLQFSNFFTTNAFFPLQGTLLFSDLLLPQSALAWVFSWFFSNSILVFNLTFLSTLFLNGAAIYSFWKTIFKQKSLIFIASLFLTFSPFFFSQLSHFQMISYWPTFFVLALLLNKKNSLIQSIVIGLLLIVQFLASVYLFIFLATAYLIWYVLNFNHHKLHFLSLILLTVCLSPFIKSYLQVRDAYQMSREYGEYVTYSAHATDYIFTPYQTTASTSLLGKKWNQYNNHSVGERAASLGILVSVLVVLGLFSYKNNRQSFSLSFKTTKLNLFFLSLLLGGFLFSLGPRLSVNGDYTSIPLPYAVLLKIFPIFEPIRATGRWSFLFYIGATYFAVLGLQKLSEKLSFKAKAIVTILVLVIFALEMIPFGSKYAAKSFSPTVYQNISDICHNGSRVLLEYPLNQTSKGANIATNLSYKTTQLLASLSHGCNLVNGYAGYDPKEYQYLENKLSQALGAGDEALFFGTVKKQGTSLIKLNKNDAGDDTSLIVEKWLKTNSQFEILFEDDSYLLAQQINL